MRRGARRLLIAAGIAAGMLAAAVVGVQVLLPRWLRGAIERLGSDGLARRVTVGGPVELSLLPEPVLSIRDVALANAAWGTEPDMVRVGRLSVRLGLRALLSGRLLLRDVAIERVRVSLERDEHGTGNWVLAIPRRPSHAKEKKAWKPVTIERASVRDLALALRKRPRSDPLRVSVRTLTARLDPADQMVDLEVEGSLDEAPWQLAGRLGTLNNLYAARDVEHTLTGRIAGSTVTLQGRIRDPLSLGGAEVTLGVEGGDAAAAAEVFGLRIPVTGPYRIDATLVPIAEGGVATRIAAEAGGMKASARGQVSALLDPARIGATLEIEGPDASVPGGWLGIAGLPPRPFEAGGTVRREGSSVVLDGMRLRVGETSATIDGTVGPPPRCEGTSLAIRGAGKDLSQLSALTRLSLPAVPFGVTGRFQRRPDGLAIERAEVRAGATTVQADGTIGEPPSLAALDLRAEARGPDASVFNSLAGVALPRAPFAAHGRIAREGRAYALDGVEIEMGADRASVRGTLSPARRLEGSALVAHAAGPSLAQTATLWGRRHDLPAVPYDVAGTVRFEPGGLALEGVEARAGELHARVAGHLATDPFPAGSRLTAQVDGDDLTALAAWGLDRVRLPRDPFSASGTLRIDGAGYRLDEGRGQVGVDRIEVAGTLGGAEGLDLAASVEGPRLAGLARFLPEERAALGRRLPDEAYAASGTIRRRPAGLELSGIDATIGETRVRLDGSASDLRFEAEGKDASLPAVLLATALPAGALRAHGRIERGPAGVRMEDVALAIGDAQATVSGMLGARPQLAGTDLDITVSGPDLAAAIGPVTGLSPLPADAFKMSARVRGDRDRLSSDRFAARLGDSDVEGDLAVTLASPRSVEADLRSKRLDVARLLDAFRERPAEPVERKEAPAKAKRGPVIPDTPLSLRALRSIEARVRLSAEELNLPAAPLRDVTIDAAIRDGALRVEPIAGTGANGGRAQGRFVLEPDGDGYRARFEGRLDGGRLHLPRGDIPPSETPTVDLELELAGSGRSLHEIASRSDGRVLAVLGAGHITNTLGDLATSAPIQGLLDALNPFRKSSPYTDFECGIAAASITAGKAEVEPIAARTDKMTIIGRGRVDLDTEAIDLVWTIKPRRGVGITPGSIANPYIKLGGTLGDPSIEAKPLEAAASTGAAVATGGLTLLFRGIYDRITAERKVCVNALERARKDEAERKAAP